MKKWVLVIAIFLILFSYSNIYAYAEKDIEQELEDSVDKYTNDIDFSLLEQYLHELEQGNISFSKGFKQSVEQILSGNFEQGLDDLFDQIIVTASTNITKYITIFVSIIAIAVLYSMLTNMTSGFVKQSTNEIIYFVCYGTIIVLVVSSLVNMSILASDTVDNVASFIDILFPILLTLVTALGGSVTVALYQGMLATLSRIITYMLSSIVIPAFLAVIVFSIVGNLSKSIKLEKLSSTIKTGAIWLMSISFGLYMVVLTVQGVGGSAFDGVSVKATKFMMSSYVPILGGYLSDGFDVIMASCALIKNAVGITGIMILLYTIISPVISILIFTFGLKVTAALLEPIADKRITDFLMGVSSATSLLISIILGIGLIVIASIMLLIVSCNGGVI